MLNNSATTKLAALLSILALAFTLACDEPGDEATPAPGGEEPTMQGDRPHFPEVAEEAERTGAEPAAVPGDDEVEEVEADGEEAAADEADDAAADDEAEESDEEAADDEEPEEED